MVRKWILASPGKHGDKMVPKIGQIHKTPLNSILGVIFQVFGPLVAYFPVEAQVHFGFFPWCLPKHQRMEDRGRNACFPKQRGWKTVHIVKDYGGSKILPTDLSAVVRKGPLG